MAVLALMGPLLWGCAGKSPAEAENREIRLTQDGGMKGMPRFSPDGKWIAFAAHSGSSSGTMGIFVISREGGEPRRLSRDSLNVYPIGWSADGTGLYCRMVDGHGLHFLGLDGSMRLVDEGEPFTRISAVFPDGRGMLALKFNQDNRDVGTKRFGGKFEFLAPTPAWEDDAVLGPGPEDITVVSTPSYQAPTTTISVWSPKTRAYEPLPLPEGQKYQPSWSADGRMLAFSSQRDGQSDLFVYDAKSARVTQLTEDPEDSTSPSWAPDGEWIAFARSTKVSHIHVGHPDQADRRQITEGPGYDFGPSVSPDGQWVAFLRKLVGGEARGKPVLCVMPVAGGPVVQLETKGLTIPGKSDEPIAWSPDGRELAFHASDGTSKSDIFRIGWDGSGLARVTVDPGDEIEPHWSPDGRHISYTKVGGGQTGVAIVPASGGLPQMASEEGRVSEGGAWAPQSDRLAFVVFRADGPTELWVTSLANPEQRTKLLESKDIIWPLRWSPDGKNVLLMRGQGATWYLSAYSFAAHAENKIGRYTMLASRKGMFAEFAPEGEKYQDLLCPGGIVLADGQDRSDLYLIRTRKPDQTAALFFGEDRLLCSGFVGLAGCY